MTSPLTALAVAIALVLAAYLGSTLANRNQQADNHVDCILEATTQQQLDAC